MSRVVMTYSRGWHSLALVRSLGRQGIEVFCGEEAPFAPCFFSRYCTGSFQYPSPADDPEGFIDFMAEKVQELKPPDGEPYVLMPVHKETWLFAKHRERFEPYVSLPLTSYENMALTHDKGRLANLAEELGIRIPQTLQFQSLDEVYRAVPDVQFPVFLKVREGASGVGLKKCNTAEELTSTFKEFVEGFHLSPGAYPLIQEFIKGEDFCTSALFDRGRPVACMTYRNVRSFPRGTGAGALRETVRLPDAEEDAKRLLAHLNWHGMAQLDFRVAEDGTAYLIEVNPRFFGGLSQAIAANVDYPHLLFRIASGEAITETPELDDTTRTEAPVVGLLATLDEIAHDDRVLDRLRRVRDGFRALGRSGPPPEEGRLKPLYDAIREAANPSDVKGYLKQMFEKHRDTINDVLQSDDPRPALGLLFPAAMMIKHGKLSMGVLTSEAELESNRPRRRFRDMLANPTWKVMLLTAALYTLGVFTVNWDVTRNNVGLVLGAPMRLAEAVFGRHESPEELARLGGAIRHTCYHALNLVAWYLLSAVALRERKERPTRESESM